MHNKTVEIYLYSFLVKSSKESSCVCVQTKLFNFLITFVYLFKNFKLKLYIKR